jgi:hypothetical protein
VLQDGAYSMIAPGLKLEGPKAIPDCMPSGGEPVEERDPAGRRSLHDGAKDQAGVTQRRLLVVEASPSMTLRRSPA